MMMKTYGRRPLRRGAACHCRAIYHAMLASSARCIFSPHSLPMQELAISSYSCYIELARATMRDDAIGCITPTRLRESHTDASGVKIGR